MNEKHIYRVDKFAVPVDAREEFLSKVQLTHNLLRTLPGFVRDMVLDQFSGPGEFNLVTIVEWESIAAIEDARTAVMDMHRKAGFDPVEVLHRLGIKADLANYQRLNI